eukprot:10904322-Ditylum_brightwellii.AAC.1
MRIKKCNDFEQSNCHPRAMIRTYVVKDWQQRICCYVARVSRPTHGPTIGHSPRSQKFKQKIYRAREENQNHPQCVIQSDFLNL